jgi:putative addiction module CopG family antidote
MDSPHPIERKSGSWAAALQNVAPLSFSALDRLSGLLLRLANMEVDLTAEQKEFIQLAIASGRLRRAEDAVREALSLWEERERARAEILAAVDAAEDSIARGEGRELTPDSMRELSSNIKERGRLRLETEQKSPR